MTPSQVAKLIHDARIGRRTISSFAEATPALTLDTAYQAQHAGLELCLAEGDVLCGYKMGLTSRAKQRDVNVHESIHGYLLERMEIPKNGLVSTMDRLQPRLEPEVAVMLRKHISGKDVTLREVRDAVGSAVPALEILDSRFNNFQFELADVVADNTSASGFMLGDWDLWSRWEQVRLMGVTVRKNGEVMTTGAPAAVLGDPLLSVLELVHQLAKYENRGLEAGMVVLTGGITASIPFQRGDLIEVVWPGETMSFRAKEEEHVPSH